ncbi:hypothetical protein BDV96DRAFT_562679 [Lophiotrema nucula]|uniref:Transferase family-domain-containing protein n=1 Tax=Lophiotrema nucula TaxID=690887 RepID=A0A6A5ZST6_9PLEO|nr:hypothetical protein BDV96DRAFT_562679 [Lophiotrema nucula]
MADWIYEDRPQLQLHIASFQDATFVTLTWLHTLFDALGRNALLRAWTMMIDGREDEVPEFYGYDFDPLASLGSPESAKLEEKPEKSVLEGRELSTWQLIRFGFSMMWEFFIYREEDQRGICIPQSLFVKLRQAALEDLASAPPDTVTMDSRDPAHPTPFLSDGDILAAWWMRLIVKSQPWSSTAPPTKTIQVQNIFGLRELLTTTEPKLLPKGVAYVSNAANAIHTFYSLQEVLELPLGYLAARIRKDLVIQGTRGQISAKERVSQHTLEKTGQHPLYGTGDMMLVTFSNWTKGKMYETDFRAAVVQEGGAKHEVGKPSYVHSNGVSETFPLRNAGCAVGKDLEGNYWVGGSARMGIWESIERAVKREAGRM